VTAADIRNLCSPLELFHNAIERRQPIGYKVGHVSGPKELLRAAEQALAVITPGDTFASLERLRNLRLVRKQRADCVVTACHACWAITIRKYRLLLRVHTKRIVLWIV